MIWSKYQCDSVERTEDLREGIRILDQFCCTRATMSNQVSVSLSIRCEEDYFSFNLTEVP